MVGGENKRAARRCVDQDARGAVAQRHGVDNRPRTRVEDVHGAVAPDQEAAAGSLTIERPRRGTWGDRRDLEYRVSARVYRAHRARRLVDDE